MANLESNLGDVAGWLDRLVDGFDFERPGKDQSLGRDLAGVVANGIRDRSVPDCVAPDQSIWPANERDYAAYKREKYDADQPNVRTGQMLSLRSLVGRTSVSNELVEMKYGTGEAPTSAFNGAELTKSDEETTDVDKAGYCTEAGRAFYGLDDTIAGGVVAEAAGALDDYLKD